MGLRVSYTSTEGTREADEDEEDERTYLTCANGPPGAVGSWSAKELNDPRAPLVMSTRVGSWAFSSMGSSMIVMKELVSKKVMKSPLGLEWEGSVRTRETGGIAEKI